MTKETWRKFYANLRKEGKLHGTIAAALVKRAARDKLQKELEAPKLSLRQRLDEAHKFVAVDGWQGRDARARASAERPRVQNWSRAQAVKQHSDKTHYDRDGSNYRGLYKRFVVVEHIPIVQSVGFITTKGLRYTYAGKSFFFKHPKGYRWRTDAYGIMLVSLKTGASYHPTGAELITSSPLVASCRAKSLRDITAKVREAHNRAAERKRKARVNEKKCKQAAREGVRVIVDDSVSSGHCLAGTLAWARLHELAQEESISPLQLLPHLQDSRVAVVLATAIKRHKQLVRQKRARAKRQQLAGT